MKIRRSLLLAGITASVFGLASLTTPPAAAFARPEPPGWQLGQGFLLRPEDRFDPFVQRLLAEQSLKALPLKGGRLFYIVPVQVDPRLEEMQIRYLELLIDQQDLEPPSREP